MGPGLSPVDVRTLLVCSFILAAALGQMNFTGDQVLRVLAKDERQLSLLRDLEGLKPQKVDFWRSPARPSLPVDMRIPFSELKNVKAYLESHGLAYSVMIKDIQVLLDEEREAMAKSRRRERSTSSFSYSSYHTLEEIYSWMDSFVAEHSDIVSKIQIGYSFENRSILVLKFSTGGFQLPAIWIDTGIHAREWITHATGIWMAREIVSKYGKDRILTDILNDMDIFLEIVTNPDGFAFTHSMNRLWRKNKSTRPGIFCIGVDLNRNWKSGFGGNGSNSNPCSETYHGPAPQSEPEVAAIVNFIRDHGNIKALISIHSYSQMLMYPYGHTLEPVSNNEELFRLAKDAVKALYEVHGIEYIYGSISTTLYLASGITVDWAYDSGIKYAFSFELRDTGHYGFLLPAAQIIPTAEETWMAIQTIMEHTYKNPYEQHNPGAEQKDFVSSTKARGGTSPQTQTLRPSRHTPALNPQKMKMSLNNSSLAQVLAVSPLGSALRGGCT
ncbi:carboxypeptidase A5 isoform X1 [Choloepus didactylus]|uniref:carboxypeptidase A5 isoform X1 n=1 Tax=Choloepus didactylus TaxID=27675 RepID=UPI0018A0735F|nr:carboxypeptidase A5 isoform X1 [Choloepus didactylus]